MRQNMITNIFCVCVILYYSNNVVLEGLIVAGASAGSYFSRYLYCRHIECCNDHWVNKDVLELINELEKNVFGQPHIQDLAKLIIGHTMSKQPDKPLVISLHGPTGTGKNHAVGIITNRLFRAGRQSKFYRIFIGSHDYHDERKLDEYRENMLNDIAATVSACPKRSLIIIDEADKLPIGLLDYLRPFMHTHESVGGIDFRNTIFILISNSGQEEIGNLALDYAHQGKSRNNIRLREIERIIRSMLFNKKNAENSGFYKSSLIGASEIDHYLAFFPLDKNHLKQCIHSRAKEINIVDIQQCIEDVISRIDFVPDDSHFFSATGCKKVKIYVDAFC